MAEPAFTLPVWLAAAAVAAVGQLLEQRFEPRPPLRLRPEDPADEPVPVPVEAAARLGVDRALGMARCEPGDGLDLTRGLPVWVEARWGDPTPRDGDAWLQLEPGEGVGIHAGSTEACLSAYARQLLDCNLRPRVPEGRILVLRITLPGGRELAQRTSNAAFGVVDGLALIGTQAEVQRSADPDQLNRALAQLRLKAQDSALGGDLALVIGENGLELAPRIGLPPALLLKAGNWIGPLLVAAAEQGLRRLLLFGYQGKLIKLAGGIFHTHHHLADGRLEVLTCQGALQGLPTDQLQALATAASVEEALQGLQAWDAAATAALRQRIAATVEQRSRAYLARHGQHDLQVGAVLFDRSRSVCASGPLGQQWLQAFQDRDLG